MGRMSQLFEMKATARISAIRRKMDLHLLIWTVYTREGYRLTW